MRRYLIILAALLAVSCSDANRQYVRKAVRIMDKQGLFAEGDGWESARSEALKAQPASLEEAQEIVRQAAKVAGGKHSFLQLARSVVADATSQWPGTGEVFCDDPIQPDVLTQTPLEDALGWINNRP